MKKVKSFTASRGVGAATLFGVGVCLLVTVLLLLVGSQCINGEYLDINRSRIIATAAQFLGTLVGVLVAGRRTEQKLLLVAGCVVGCYLLILLAVGTFAFDGIGAGVPVGILACILGCGGGVVLCGKAKRTGGKRKRKNAIR